MSDFKLHGCQVGLDQSSREYMPLGRLIHQGFSKPVLNQDRACRSVSWCGKRLLPRVDRSAPDDCSPGI